MNIVHITTVHQRFDSRIFYKQCLSLKEHSYRVTLIVADGKGNQTVNGVDIIDIGAYTNRAKRLIVASRKAVQTALKLNADLYHFHDPDLLVQARKLCKHAKVVFDSHEDFPKLMLQRDYIPNVLRKVLFRTATHIERTTYKKLAGVVTATDNIAQKFLSYGANDVIAVKNYPVINTDNCVKKEKDNGLPFTACYVGGLTQVRGVEQMIKSCHKAGVHLILAGPFDDENFYRQMQSLPEWECVEYLGVVPHDELVQRVYAKADIGLNMLLAAPNHTDAVPIKQLEYMSQALPVIATKHIKFCTEVTEKEHCGILVTPEDIQQCAEAITYMKNHEEERIEMGVNGRRAVQQTYNWNTEKDKLIKFYERLLNNQ
ncbi:MAG: glycosyltransferase [Bacteroidales bacterium]|nr:glycosyltransferase [Bacteroidales bacterium]MBP3254717.1 glycosyltransferase [Bacteroidales bacterium]